MHAWRVVAPSYCLKASLHAADVLLRIAGPIQSHADTAGVPATQVASIAVTVWFNYVGSRVKFWITWPVALAGAFITWFFIADLTGLDLAEQVCAASSFIRRLDKLTAFAEGHRAASNGLALASSHISNF